MFPSQSVLGTDPQLSLCLRMLAKAAHPGLRAAYRSLTQGDEFALTSRELTQLGQAVAPVRRASGAARMVAKELLRGLGGPASIDLLKSESGAPRWPEGYIGSLAHDSEVAIAAVASSESLRSVGVDVEPAHPLPRQLLDLVATPSERRQINGDLFVARRLFCIKEAVYKTTNPLDNVFLEYHDVEVCLASSIARTRSGFSLRLYTADSPRLLAVATLIA